MVMARELEKAPAKALEVGKPAFVTVASIVEIVSIHSYFLKNNTAICIVLLKANTQGRMPSVTEIHQLNH